jgi:hypothetical protein
MKALNYVPILLLIIPTIILYFSGLWKKKGAKKVANK